MSEIIDKLRQQAEESFRELIDLSHFRRGDLIVIGGSSSEIQGGHIGKDSSFEVGDAVVGSLMDVAGEYGLRLAFQCCEHLNRALVVERDTMEHFGLEEVSAVPWLHAGGAFATGAYGRWEDPVLVQEVRAHGGLDIGLTMIGMHLQRVAVPVRLAHNHVGKALVAAARTRPPLIGGERARYKKG